MELNEVLCRAWIECDPNRAGGEPGSGFHPDDVEGELLYSSGGGHEVETHPNPRAGMPRWKWFEPRATALKAYLEKHGYAIVPAA